MLPLCSQTHHRKTSLNHQTTMTHLNQEEIWETINNIIGPSGKMLSSSKSGYRQKNMDNHIIFNAVITQQNQKLWTGDLDLTKEDEKLLALAQSIGSFQVHAEQWIFNPTTTAPEKTYHKNT